MTRYWTNAPLDELGGHATQQGVNGKNIRKSTIGTRPNSQSEPTSTIGYGAEFHGSYWKGGISSVRIYNKILTDAQLAQLFTLLKARYGI